MKYGPSEGQTPEEFLEELAKHPDFVGKFTTHPLLLRAAGKVQGPRQQEYGEKVENFQDIADFWTTFLRLKLKPDAKITRLDVALMQDLTKTARLMKMPTHEDGRDDKVGYVICLDDIIRWLEENEGQE